MKHYKKSIVLFCTLLGFCFAQNIRQSLYFQPTKYEISPEGLVQLQQLSDSLLNSDKIYNVFVTGYTDADGTQEENLALSQKRCEAVAFNLISKGVSSENISMNHYGETRAAFSNKSDEGKQKNRRVDIEVQFRDTETIFQSLSDLYKELMPEPQYFAYNPFRDTIFIGSKGTAILFQANTLNISPEELDGRMVSIQLREAIEFSDMLSMNLTTLSDNQPLQTGGMFEIRASIDNRQLEMKPNTEYFVTVSTDSVKEDMQLFTGVETESGLNWVAPREMMPKEKATCSRPQNFPRRKANKVLSRVKVKDPDRIVPIALGCNDVKARAYLVKKNLITKEQYKDLCIYCEYNLAPKPMPEKSNLYELLHKKEYEGRERSMERYEAKEEAKRVVAQKYQDKPLSILNQYIDSVSLAYNKAEQLRYEAEMAAIQNKVDSLREKGRMVSYLAEPRHKNLNYKGRSILIFEEETDSMYQNRVDKWLLNPENKAAYIEYIACRKQNKAEQIKDRVEKFKRNRYARSKKEKDLASAGFKEVDDYVIKMGNFGWANCDRFPQEGPRTLVKTTVKEDNETCLRLIDPTDVSVFRSNTPVPTGRKMIAMATKVKKGKGIFLGISDVVADENVHSVDFQPVTVEELKEKLLEINPNTPATQTQFNLFPNPIQAKTTYFGDAGLLEIYTLQGQLVKSIEVPENTDFEIDFSELSSDLYVAQLTPSKEALRVKSKRFIKQ